MESLNTKISNVKEGKKIKDEEKKADGEVVCSRGFDMFSEDNDMFSEKYVSIVKFLPKINVNVHDQLK